MGILNITPDSFSDGGKYFNKNKALNHATNLINGGADIIDIGGESSRPGALPITIDEEKNRVIPIISDLRKENPDILISVDTCKSEVAEEAIEVGADIINDISGLKDIKMPNVIQKNKTPIIIPNTVPIIPISEPQIKKILNIEFLVKPIDLKIPISLPLFFTNITIPDIMFIAAIRIIKDNIKNITRLSKSSASRKAAVLSFQDQMI